MKHKVKRGILLTYQTNRIAILMATYNGEDFIEQQLDSLIAQTYRDWELYIHDDGSLDATPAILERYANAFPNQIHLVNGASRGSAKRNFLFLMNNIDAPYIMFCDQDDVWNSSKIEYSLSAIKVLESKKDKNIPLLIFSDSTVSDRELHVIRKSFFSFQRLNPNRILFSELLVQNVVPGNTVIFNQALLQYAVKYSNEDNIIMHDSWCALIAAYFGAIDVIRESTLLYRQHQNNVLGANKAYGLKYLFIMLTRLDVLKKSIRASRLQAEEFAKAFELGADSLPARYATIGELSKKQRLCFYRKYGIHKSGLFRNIGFYIFG